jgi:hypothetical protein
MTRTKVPLSACSDTTFVISSTALSVTWIKEELTIKGTSELVGYIAYTLYIKITDSAVTFK